MRKIWAIAWKDIYLTFTDRSLLLIMLLTPLALSVIIGLAFGGSGGGTVGGFRDIPIAVVNLDEGTETANLGQTFVDIFVPDSTDDSGTGTSCDLITDDSDASADQTTIGLDELFVTTVLSDPETARTGVTDGTYIAAIIIPADFSAQLTPSQNGLEAPELGRTSVEVLGSSGSPLSASIARSVTENIVNQFVTGNVAIVTTIDGLIERAQDQPFFGVQFLAANLLGEFQPDFTCAFASDVGTLSIDQQPLNVTQEQSGFVQVLVFTGAAQAVFFALFTGQFGLLTIYGERTEGTLQRLIVTPMPRAYILIGKLVGVFLSVVLQLLVLIISLTVVASLLEGQALFIWGDNILLLIILVLVLALSVSGIGILIVSLASTEEQTRVIGPVLNAGFAALGGAFGFSVPQVVAQFSPVFWGRDAFTQLAAGNADIGLNLLVLLVQGGLMFLIGLWLFNRRKGI